MKPFVVLRMSAALINAALMLTLAIPVQAQTALSGTWSVQASSDPSTVSFGGRYDNGDYHSDWAHPVPLSSLVGLTREQLQSNGTNVRFDLVSEPGTFRCTGYTGHGAGGGTFTFAPSAGFANALASRGISRPDDLQMLRMATANVTIGFIDMLRRNTTSVLTPEDIVRILNHGVDERYVTGLASAGYRDLGAEDYVRLRDHGVTIEFVQGMIGLGYRPTAEELVRLRDHGVTLDFVRRVKDHGYNASVEQLIRMRDSGVD